MSQEQLDQLDSVITPEVVNTIVMLLPELVALINAIDNDQKPYPDKEFGNRKKQIAPHQKQYLGGSKTTSLMPQAMSVKQQQPEPLMSSLI